MYIRTYLGYPRPTPLCFCRWAIEGVGPVLLGVPPLLGVVAEDIITDHIIPRIFLRLLNFSRAPAASGDGSSGVLTFLSYLSCHLPFALIAPAAAHSGFFGTSPPRVPCSASASRALD